MDYWWADRIDGWEHHRRQWRRFRRQLGEARDWVHWAWSDQLGGAARRILHLARRPGRPSGRARWPARWFAAGRSRIGGWLTAGRHRLGNARDRVRAARTTLGGGVRRTLHLGRWPARWFTAGRTRLTAGRSRIGGWFAAGRTRLGAWFTSRRTAGGGRPAWRSLRPLGIVVAILLVGVGVAVAVLPWSPDERPPVASQVAQDDRDGRASSGPGGDDRSGPGFTMTGINLTVTPDEFGDLEAVERIIMPTPVRSLILAAPPQLRDQAGPLARVVGLQVSADGSPVALGESGLVNNSGELALPVAASRLELRYRVVDADRRSSAAPERRASLSLRPAAWAALSSAPTVVEVRGAVVHALECVATPKEQRLCGVDDRYGWHTLPVPAATSSVLALVDLPAMSP